MRVRGTAMLETGIREGLKRRMVGCWARAGLEGLFSWGNRTPCVYLVPLEWTTNEMAAGKHTLLRLSIHNVFMERRAGIHGTMTLPFKVHGAFCSAKCHVVGRVPGIACTAGKQIKSQMSNSTVDPGRRDEDGGFPEARIETRQGKINNELLAGDSANACNASSGWFLGA